MSLKSIDIEINVNNKINSRFLSGSKSRPVKCSSADRRLSENRKSTGVTVDQVARVTKNFANSGILVHAYLMYGFPSQTEQETVCSLERVRQLMLNGCIHSAYWHRFAATIHSPVSMNPEQYNIELIPNGEALFAENDINYHDPVNTDHKMRGKGLKKALYNYMHGMGFDYPMDFWFEKTINKPKISPRSLSENRSRSEGRLV